MHARCAENNSAIIWKDNKGKKKKSCVPRCKIIHRIAIYRVNYLEPSRSQKRRVTVIIIRRAHNQLRVITAGMIINGCKKSQGFVARLSSVSATFCVWVNAANCMYNDARPAARRPRRKACIVAAALIRDLRNRFALLSSPPPRVNPQLIRSRLHPSAHIRSLPLRDFARTRNWISRAATPYIRSPRRVREFEIHCTRDAKLFSRTRRDFRA